MYMRYLEIPMGKARYPKRYLEIHLEQRDTLNVHEIY